MGANKMNPAAKGNCYEAALELFVKYVTRTGAEVLLCHGIVRQSKPPHVQMGHAWVEEEHYGFTFVRDALYPEMLTHRERYYELGHINPENVVRYTGPEVLGRIAATGTSGPWARHIKAAAHAGSPAGK